MAMAFNTTGGAEASALLAPMSRSAQLAISDQNIEALMGGHAATIPDTRRQNVTQPRLHDAYIGSNEFLSNTMVDLLLTSDISFVTTVLLPLFHHDNPQIKWKEISEDNGIMEPEQEGGVPSLKSSSTQEFSAYMQRYGRAAIFSHGFANTEAGRGLFRVRLAHMAKEIQRTLDIRGLYAIISCQNHYISVFSNLRDDYNSGGAIRAIDCFEREVASFAMLQKEERGLYTLDERLRTKLELNGANPDSWIMLTEMISHCAMEDAEVEYYRAGGVARTHLRKGKESLATFRGCNVYPVKDYDVYGRSINAFKRIRMIGDYWIVRDFGHGRNMDGSQTMAQRTQTDVYCCGTDRFENFSLDAHLKWNQDLMHMLYDTASVINKRNGGVGFTDHDEAVKAIMNESILLQVSEEVAGRWYVIPFYLGLLVNRHFELEAGARNYVPGRYAELMTIIEDTGLPVRDLEGFSLEDMFECLQSATTDAANTGRLDKCYDDIEYDQPEERNCLGMGFATLWGTMIANATHAKHKKLSCPFAVAFYRPFRRYEMGSAVLMQAGRNAGITAYAHTDMQVGNDAQSKQTLVHFTGNFASVIIDPRRIAVAPDIYCCDYKGGEGAKTINYCDFREHDYRLNPKAYVEEKNEDIFVVPAPYLCGANLDHGETSKVTRCSDPVDICGNYMQCCPRSPEMCYTPGAQVLYHAYGIKNIKAEVDNIADHVDNMDVFHTVTPTNTTCFRAHQKVIADDGTNTCFIRGTGHFGDFIGPGSRSARKGITSEFKAMKFEEMNLKEIPR